MITLQFPAIHKILPSEAFSSDVVHRKGVLVLNNCAIVITPKIMAVIDLEALFVGNSTDEVLIQETKEILDYMNQKVFPASYWEELTKKQFVFYDNDSEKIGIKGLGYEKMLDNELDQFDPIPVLNILNFFKDEMETDATFYSDFSDLNLIVKAFSNVLKVDKIRIVNLRNSYRINSLNHILYCNIVKDEDFEIYTVKDHLNTF